jgi:hypothetical protein
MAMVFPTSPTVGQVFTSAGRSWVWNGSAWDAPSATNVLTVPIGLELIRTATFSGAVSHSFGSDADPIFTSKYSNYKIVLTNIFAASGEQEISFRLRANTTDLTSATYQYQVFLASSTTVSGIRSAAVTAHRIGTTGNAQPSSTIVEVHSPALTLNTVVMSNSMGIVPGAGPLITSSNGYIFNTVSYNGFTILTPVNLSGTMSVYGYNK